MVLASILLLSYFDLILFFVLSYFHLQHTWAMKLEDLTSILLLPFFDQFWLLCILFSSSTHLSWDRCWTSFNLIVVLICPSHLSRILSLLLFFFDLTLLLELSYFCQYPLSHPRSKYCIWTVWRILQFPHHFWRDQDPGPVPWVGECGENALFGLCLFYGRGGWIGCKRFASSSKTNFLQTFFSSSSFCAPLVTLIPTPSSLQAAALSRLLPSKSTREREGGRGAALVHVLYRKW